MAYYKVLTDIHLDTLKMATVMLAEALDNYQHSTRLIPESRSYSLNFRRENVRTRITKNSFRIARSPTEIRAGRRRNTSLEHYRYVNLLGVNKHDPENFVTTNFMERAVTIY
jgi:hypothetical protein